MPRYLTDWKPREDVYALWTDHQGVARVSSGYVLRPLDKDKETRDFEVVITHGDHAGERLCFDVHEMYTPDA